MTGLLYIDKPVGMTSHDVVNRVRRASGMRRVGHTGTLDPAATGLLILCLGRATRLSEHLTGMGKEYEGCMRLGLVTDSYDLDGAVLEEHAVPALDAGVIQGVCDGFTGEFEQIPPMVSAVKVGGERLYKKARKGEVVERAPRLIRVEEFRVLSYAAPEAQVRVRCGSGVYVRSLCHDVGQKLGCGAALASLRRTAVGRHRVEEAIALEELTDASSVEAVLQRMDDALDLPEIVVGAGGRDLIMTGATLTRNAYVGDCPVQSGWVQIKDEAGRLLALGEVRASAVGAQIHPRRVFIG